MSRNNPPWTEEIRSRARGRVAVLGIGSTLRGDDGVGPEVAGRLAAEFKGCIFDGGTAPENFLGPISSLRPDTLIFVDAADFNAPPGSVGVFELEEISSVNISTHTIPLSLLWREFKRRGVPYGFLIAIQPKSLEFRPGLSSEVEGAASQVASVLGEIIGL